MTEQIADKELCELLERNGYPSAAENIVAGIERATATAYILESPPVYSDGEALWLRDYVASLQEAAQRVEP